MKKIALFILIVMTIVSCTQKESGQVAKNYVPETPKLSSDVMTPEVLWSFGRLGGAQVSPDGSTVLYTVTYYNIEENKSYRDIYTIPVAGGEAKNITNTASNEYNVVWRPDGKKIGYLSSASGSVQLWEMNPDGSNKQQVSEIEGGIFGFQYAPDLSKIYYLQTVKLDNDIHDLFPDLPKANARLETDIMYRHWDTWHDYTYNHIFIADYSDGKVGEGKDIMAGERFDSPMKPFGGTEQIVWSPDSKTLAYVCKKKVGREYAVSTNSDIYLYDVVSGETSNFTEGMMGYDQNPFYSPDGKYLAWESMERDGYEADKNRLFVADLETGEKKDYSANFDQNAASLSWSADSKSIYFISDIHATDEIYKLELADNSIVRLTDGVHNYQSAVPVGNQLLAQKVSMSQPAELYLVDPANGKDKALTTVNKGILDQLTMGKVEKRWMETTDGKQMAVWVIYPPHFDPNKKYPTLLYNQGGPQGTVSQFWSYRWNFQMMAANDYIIVAPNRRGLPGFGQEWNEQISKDYGGQNIKDLLTAIDEMAKEPFVDETKLGAVGASYGGFSVMYLAGNHEKRFKAFIAHDGIFNFEHMYTTTEEMWFVNFDYGGAYWDKDNAAAQRSYSFSPHKYVQNWDTPILIVQGEKDYRVPAEQGMAAFNAAVLRGVPAQMLYLPEENHWVLQPQNGILWQRVFFNWLDKWLK
ncbi:Dipeptidyl aminopeptidase/acylaminoacyl peptidase [Draconibacterium orientale]|jgi:dipeptidyl aminopeptidase/acylaminoacyl peptidase|uniref:Dipeptidyl-peptidase 5 n=1 Tax=Draconibacterium orientale TaxID=1168034 RepID=X5E1Q5_9BACT|nr:S9 family peptidase [Draconibacterium orientale]AHW61385.1 peptidase S9 [Draconibacterium orientale]SEU08341.1 Dipeptidyl aminopeptidase/acylaminoacyl peptidase [Draconibacterium orientale]